MSLSENGQKITSEPQTYHVDEDCLFSSCAMLFKVSMNEALFDNRTTTTMYKANLASLDVHIGILNSDIEVINQYVLDSC